MYKYQFRVGTNKARVPLRDLILPPSTLEMYDFLTCQVRLGGSQILSSQNTSRNLVVFKDILIADLSAS